jgi:hypothetical protein
MIWIVVAYVTEELHVLFNVGVHLPWVVLELYEFLFEQLEMLVEFFLVKLWIPLNLVLELLQY